VGVEQKSFTPNPLQRHRQRWQLRQEPPGGPGGASRLRAGQGWDLPGPCRMEMGMGMGMGMGLARSLRDGNGDGDRDRTCQVPAGWR